MPDTNAIRPASSLPWRWAPGWDSDELPTADEGFSGGKYVDCTLYDAEGGEVIPIGIDHYQRIWDTSAVPELSPRKADRDYIVHAANEHPRLVARVAELEAALGFYADPASHDAKEFVSPAVRPEASNFPSDEERWDSTEYIEDAGDIARKALENK